LIRLTTEPAFYESDNCIEPAEAGEILVTVIRRELALLRLGCGS